MRFTTSVLLGAAAGFALGLSNATTVLASPALQGLADIVTQVEALILLGPIAPTKAS